MFQITDVTAEVENESGALDFLRHVVLFGVKTAPIRVGSNQDIRKYTLYMTLGMHIGTMESVERK